MQFGESNMIRRTMLLLIAVVPVLMLLSACSRHGPKTFNKLSDLRAEPPDLQTYEISIPRVQFKEAMRNGKALESMRLVPIYTGGEDNSVRPEYRILDLSPGSAPWVIGLRNADVLVGLNGYILRDTTRFGTYLVLAEREGKGEIEIRREGKPILIKFAFTQ
jgi:hypothetical protein